LLNHHFVSLMNVDFGDANPITEILSAKNMQGFTPLLLACAIPDDSLPIVKILLEAGAIISAVDSRGRNALHLACMMEKISVVDYLIHQHNLLDQRTFLFQNLVDPRTKAPIKVFTRAMESETRDDILDTVDVENPASSDYQFRRNGLFWRAWSHYLQQHNSQATPQTVADSSFFSSSDNSPHREMTLPFDTVHSSRLHRSGSSFSSSSFVDWLENDDDADDDYLNGGTRPNPFELRDSPGSQKSVPHHRRTNSHSSSTSGPASNHTGSFSVVPSDQSVEVPHIVRHLSSSDRLMSRLRENKGKKIADMLRRVADAAHEVGEAQHPLHSTSAFSFDAGAWF
jgi:hypothetical protein